MIMLEDCIEKIERKMQLNDILYEQSVSKKEIEEERELVKSIYYHLLDYKEVLNKAIELTNEINNISNRWELVKKANEN